MKRTRNMLLLIFVAMLSLSCSAQSDLKEEESSLYTITVNFEYGENAPSNLKNIYVIWMEDTTSGFLQNIFICQKLITGGLTGTVLPYWKSNKYPKSSGSEVDAVTSATQANTDFTVSAVLKDASVTNFVLYLEIDRYAEPNDWFSDQPALLYSANIYVDDVTQEYELSPIGWTPHEAAVNVIPNTPFGKLQNEMRYITNHKVGTSFGDIDERSATRMVKRLTATLEKSIETAAITKKSDHFSISLFPNPTTNQITVKSRDIIEEVAIFNINSQMIIHILPKAFETAIILNKADTPKGTYFAKIKTGKSTSTHKIIISE